MVQFLARSASYVDGWYEDIGGIRRHVKGDA
jgi:hypothetical protein